MSMVFDAGEGDLSPEPPATFVPIDTIVVPWSSPSRGDATLDRPRRGARDINPEYLRRVSFQDAKSSRPRINDPRTLESISKLPSTPSRWGFPPRFCRRHRPVVSTICPAASTLWIRRKNSSGLIASSIALPLFFFFNDTATTENYTLSLHDALPI